MTFTVALTGGIGSGKSEVSHLFSELGVPIIDADGIAHEILESNPTAIRTVADHFGSRIFKKGLPDRALLRDVIFQNKNERLWLERLLHPLIIEEMRTQRSRVTASYCIMVVPLLSPSSALIAVLDRILVVDAPQALRVKRLKKRDNLSDSIIKVIMNAQISCVERLAMADDIISNHLTRADLKTTVLSLHRQYMRLAFD